MPYSSVRLLSQFGHYHQLQQAQIYFQYQASTQIWTTYSGEKNNIIEPEQDRDPYPWIIWYIWKGKNDKLFRGIDRDPFELVRPAESECQAWFDANEVVQPVIQDNNTEEPQVISLGNICLIDGSWISTAHFSGCGWVLMDSGGQLMGTRNFTRRESALHSEVEALRWAMENMHHHSTCQSFKTDCNELIAMIKEPQASPRFVTEFKKIKKLQICFLDFNIIHVPRARNHISDFLSKTARSFHREYILLVILFQFGYPDYFKFE